MKYLQSFNESNKFLALKEDLLQIKDICKSEEFLDHFNLVIGHCGVNQNYSGMDTYMNDIFIKMATIGHQAIVVALDFHETELGKLPQQEFDIVKSTFVRILDYLQMCEYNILHVWFKKIDPRQSRIDWFDYDLSECVSKFEAINFTGASYVTEIRIVFTGIKLED